VPVVLLLIGLVLFYFYPINEERRGQIQKELQKAEWVSILLIVPIPYSGSTLLGLIGWADCMLDWHLVVDHCSCLVFVFLANQIKVLLGTCTWYSHLLTC
jgi:hypothetical protein